MFEAERQQLMADQEMAHSMGGDGNDPDDLGEIRKKKGGAVMEGPHRPNSRHACLVALALCLQ